MNDTLKLPPIEWLRHREQTCRECLPKEAAGYPHAIEIAEKYGECAATILALTAEVERMRRERDAALKRNITNTTRWVNISALLEKERDAARASLAAAEKACRAALGDEHGGLYALGKQVGQSDEHDLMAVRATVERAAKIECMLRSALTPQPPTGKEQA